MKYHLDKSKNCTWNIDGTKTETLYQIVADTGFTTLVGRVNKGDRGGWVSSEKNLSQCGQCWITRDAVVCQNAKVTQNAIVGRWSNVCENATISANAIIGDGATIRGNAKVTDFATIQGNAIIKDNAIVMDSAFVKGDAEVSDSARILSYAEVSGMCKIKGGVDIEGKVTDEAIVNGTFHLTDSGHIGSMAHIFAAGTVAGEMIGTTRVDKGVVLDIAEKALIFGESYLQSGNITIIGAGWFKDIQINGDCLIENGMIMKGPGE